MIGEIEMGEREGTCKYCGQMVWVRAADQVDANEKASEKCECGGYRKAVRYKNAETYIREICGSKSANQMLEEETIEGLCGLAKLINEEHIDTVAVGIGTARITMKMTAQDKIRITRVDKQHYAKEA